MKNIILSLAATLVLFSCNQKNKVEATQNSVNANTEITKVNSDSFSVEEIVVNYLTMKNALIKDDAKTAAEAGNAMVVTLGKIDMSKISGDQMKSYMDIADDVKEHAEHIGSNGDNIEHQREHFVTLSTDINDLIKLFGTNQKLYLDFCPMADNNKGAVWISETKEISNPYYGASMSTCGSIKTEY